MAYLQGLMSCSAEIVLTTHFSGMWTSEMALAMIEDMLQQHGISFANACALCHRFQPRLPEGADVIPTPHGPEHVFGES